MCSCCCFGSFVSALFVLLSFDFERSAILDAVMNVVGNIVDIEGLVDLDDLEDFENLVDLPPVPIVRQPA